MRNSDLFLGIKNIVSAKLGVSDVKLILGTKLLYPLNEGKISIHDAVVTCDSATYNGSSQVAQNIVVTLSGDTLVSGTDYTVTSNTGGTNAGSYNVTVSGTGNYKGSASGTFTINKANPTYTAPTAKSLTYNGSAQSLLNAGSTNHGTIQYSSDGSNWGATIPSQTNANTYTAYWKLVGDSNHNDVSSTSISTTIAKANQSAPTATGAKVYEGSTATATASGGGGQGSLEWSNGSTRTTLGSQTTKARWSGNGNYNASSWSNEVTLEVIKKVVVAAKFNVTSTSNPTKIASGTTSFTKIEIDGVEQPSVTTGYTFSTSGEHTVKYHLINTSIGYQAFNSCSSLTSIEIPNGVTSIGISAFSGCRSLTSIDIPDSVTSIGDSAFVGCRSLTSVTIGNSVTSIGEGTFFNCSSLASIDIPNSVTRIGNQTFGSCSSLTSCTIGSGVTSIGDESFRYCTGLTSVVIPDSVTSIGSYAFYECTSLTSCTIGNSVTSIGSNDFEGCNSLTSIDIPNGVTSIGNQAFQSCTSLTSVTIGNSVTSIGGSAFYGCSSLTSINIPNGVASIGANAFNGCTNLTSCTIGNSVTSISSSAFAYCSSLTSINIPNGVASIGANAFNGCTNLTSCTIGNSVTSIGSNAFYNCRNLTSIVSNRITAPTISNYTFRDIKTGGTLTAPSGSSGYDVWMGTDDYYLGKYGWTYVDPCKQYDYVEIGGVKWATKNVGACDITDTGLYFQWGDISGYTASQVGSGEGKKYFGWADYKYGNGTSSPDASGMTKYNSSDGKAVLETADDAARAALGGQWRMPTDAEYAALGNAVTIAWTADYQGSGVAGMICTDKTDSSKTLFFPACGYCYNGSFYFRGSRGRYWSNSLVISSVRQASILSFVVNDDFVIWQNWDYRFHGFPVRPVVG